MKVGELIARLEKLDPEKRVVIKREAKPFVVFPEVVDAEAIELFKTKRKNADPEEVIRLVLSE